MIRKPILENCTETLIQCIRIVSVAGMLAVCSTAQEIVPLIDGYAGSTMNQHLLSVKHGLKSSDSNDAAKPKVVVFVGDRVIAQFRRWVLMADGCDRH